MTVWAEKTVSIDEWGRVQEAFEKHFMVLGGPRDMMLVRVEAIPGSQTARLIVGLPEGVPLALYEGFIEISDDQLPRATSGLVCRQNRFEELFEYPKR